MQKLLVLSSTDNGSNSFGEFGDEIANLFYGAR